MADLDVTVANRSVESSGPVSLAFDATHAGTGESTTQLIVTLDPITGGQSVVATLRWNTQGLTPGDYDISVRVVTADDGDDGDNLLTGSVKLVNALTLAEVSPKTATAVVGDTIEFVIKVKNLSDADLQNTAVALYELNETDALVVAAIGAIVAGETATAKLKWDATTEKGANRSLIVVASADGQTADDDDWQWVTVHVRNPIAVTDAKAGSEYAVIGDTLVITAQVLNPSVDAVSDVTIKLHINGATDPVDTVVIDSIPAGATVATTLDWETEGAAAGEHSLGISASVAGYAADADDSACIAVSLQEPLVNVAFVGDPAVAEAAVAGNTVPVRVTLSNQGNVSAAPTVSLYVGDAAEPADTQAMAAIPPGSTGEVTLQWDTTAFANLPGEQVLQLRAEEPDDADTTDNSATASINLYRSAFGQPGAPDKCLDDIAVSIGGIRGIGEPLKDPPHYSLDETLLIDYQIYNYTCDTAVTVDADLSATKTGVAIEDDEALCLAGCFVPAGGMAEAVAVWPLANVPETIEETVQAAITVSFPTEFDDADADNDADTSYQRISIITVDPDDIKIIIGAAETDKGFAKGEINLPDFGSVNLRLRSATLEPTTLSHSEATMALTIDAVNEGSFTEPATVELYRVSSNGLELKMLYTHTIVVPPGGETESIVLEVPTNGLDTGTHSLQVGLAAVNNIAAENNKITFAVTRLAPPGVPVVPVYNDVEIVGITSVPPGEAMQGQWVEVHVTLRNNGARAVNAPVVLTFPSADKRPEQKSPRLLPGADGSASFTWKTRNYEPGRHTLRANLRLDNNATAGDTEAELSFLLTPQAVVATILDVSAEPAAPVAGDPVDITVRVRNDGPVAVNIPVTLRFPSADKQPEIRRPRINPGETGVARFTWRTGNYDPGAHSFTVEAGTAVHNFAIELLAATADFTVSELTPPAATLPIVQGDWVEVTTLVQNLGPHAGRADVILRDITRQDAMYRKGVSLEPGASQAVSFTWKTLRYPPGNYQVQATVQAEYDTNPDNDASEVASVAVLTNRDITIGSVNGSQPSQMSGAMPGPAMPAMRPHYRQYPGDDILVFSGGSTGNEGSKGISVAMSRPEFGAPRPSAISAASVVDISATPEFPVVGDAVTIAVTVRNDGLVAASIPVTLHFPSSEKQPETRQPRVAPGETATVTFTWRTGNYNPGAHQFRVETPTASPSTRQFTVVLRPSVIDAAIVGLGANPSGSAMRGQEVEIWVAVRNNGPVAVSVPVQLAFPSDAKLPERKSPRVGPGETARVTFTWRTANYAVGEHTLVATLLDGSEASILGSAMQLHFTLTAPAIQASVVGTSFVPQSPVVGDAVTIAVTVRNDGLVAANIPVTLHFPSSEKQPETRQPRVAPGETATATFTWRTGNYDPGAHQFRVETPTASPSTRQFTVVLRPSVIDAAIVGLGANPSGSAMRGQEVEIWVAVRNNGLVAVSVPVQLAFPSEAKLPERKSPRVGPGETARVTFTWKTTNYAVGEHTLVATLLDGSDTSIAGSAMELRFTLTAPANQASIVGTSFMPQSPVVGDAVTIAVRVRNDGLVAASIPVTLHFPSSEKQPETRQPRVAPGETATAEFTWRTSYYHPGTHEFRIEVGAESPVVHRVTVELLPPLADFAALAIYPPSPSYPIARGDWAEVGAFVRNLGPHQGRATIRLYNETERKSMYSKSVSLEPGESRIIDFIWKTLRYPEGEHRLSIRVSARYDNNSGNDRSPAATVNLLTDRDISLGFKSNVRPDNVIGDAASPNIRVSSQYPGEIHVIDNNVPQAAATFRPAPLDPLSAEPTPPAVPPVPTAMHRLRLAAQTSATDCARFQSLLGFIQPRTVLCPQAPSLVH